MPRSSREPERSLRDWARSPATWRQALILLVVSALCTLITVDVRRTSVDPVAVGDVARHTVRAPLTFTWRDAAAAAAAKAAAAAAEPPVFLYDEAWLVELRARLLGVLREARATEESGGDGLEVLAREGVRQGALSLPRDRLAPLAAARFPDEAALAVVSWLGEAYGERLYPTDRAELPGEGKPIWVVPLVGDRDAFQVADTGRFGTLDDVRRSVTLSALRASDAGPWVAGAEALALSWVAPNLFFDAARTESARAAASAAVTGEDLIVRRGEIVIREGDRVTASQAARLDALRANASNRSLVGGWLAVGGLLTVLLSGLHLASRRYLRSEDETRDVAATGLLLVVVCLLSRVVVALSDAAAVQIGEDVPASALWSLIPAAGGGMTVRLLMSPTRAVVFVVAASAVCGLVTGLDAVSVLYFLLTGLVAIGSVEHLRERIAVLRAGMVTGLFGAVVVALEHVARGWVGGGGATPTVQGLWVSSAAALGGGLFSAVLVLVLVPVFEGLGFVTDWRMLELASLNHPLMRNLMLRAPGTYHHSVVVGTLAEAACEAIGANGLQAKVAAYFHDIGKVVKPQFFIENQRGGHNRHADVDPLTSAQIIIGHVVHGHRMAREHKLPKPIVDNILMHHGTGLLQYFYARAAAAMPGQPVDDAAFRYPGPKPNNREAGVIMLADKVEAATRTVRHPTEANVRAMIHKIINSVMADDQFSDCPLTFKEISVVSEVFVRVIVGIYHQRVDYPQTAALSLGGVPRDAAGALGVPPPSRERREAVTGITLELDGGSLARTADGFLPEVDDGTDYESVRYLPDGDTDEAELDGADPLQERAP